MCVLCAKIKIQQRTRKITKKTTKKILYTKTCIEFGGEKKADKR